MSQSLLALVNAFLASCREPVLLEPGEEPIILTPGNLLLEAGGPELLLQAWDSTRNLTRKVTAARESGRAKLELTVRRFGKRSGSITLIDRARPGNIAAARKAERLVAREQFRRMLLRNYPGWRIAELSADADLEHSLSPAYSRALLRRGTTGWAAVAAPADGRHAQDVLTTGLIWLDYLRRRESRVLIEGLAVFVPAGTEVATALRIRHLSPAAGRVALFTYAGKEWERQVDVNVHGNLDTRLEAAATIKAVARPRHPLPPEAELEAIVRRDIRAVDAHLLESPLYGQVPAMAGCDRGILDLLAADCTGRLAVVELKATADMQMPLQALDYWMRVDWHQRAGEFTQRGYFPGVALRKAPPRLLLVAPALQFHPTTETILRYLSPGIEVERVGLTIEWRKELAVLFRVRGAGAPD